MERLSARAHGNVQGVGYRSRIVTIAKAFGLKGCVQNLKDGTVKVIAEGGREDLERFLNAINVKNALIQVEKIDHSFSEPVGEFDDFYKLVGEGETDERLDRAAEYLKELISVTKSGFSELKNVVIEESEKTRTVLGSKIDQIGDKVDQLGDKMDRLGEKVDEVGKKVDRVGEKVDEVGRKVEEVGKKVDRVGEKVDEVGRKVEEVGKKVDRVGEKVDEVGKKVDRVGEKVEEVGNKVDRVGEKVDEVGGKVEQVSSRIDLTRKELGSKIDKLRL